VLILAYLGTLIFFFRTRALDPQDLR